MKQDKQTCFPIITGKLQKQFENECGEKTDETPQICGYYGRAWQGALAVLKAQIECYAGIALWRTMLHKERINQMKYKLENVSSEEQSYLFVLAENDTHSETRIGYLRGDFGCDGDEFWHTWFPCNEEFNVSEFKADLDAVIDWLRSNRESALLKDRRTMDAVCRQYPENHMENQWRLVLLQDRKREIYILSPLLYRYW